jgi:hypothetical protein
MMDLLERFQALSHDECETIRQALFPQLSSQQPAQQPCQHPNQQAAPVLGGTAVQHADPMQIDFRVQPLQLHEKNLPPPDPKYDGSTYWGRYAQTVQQWLVASNTPTRLWGVRALACLSGEASDYLHQQLLEADLSYEQVVSNSQLLPWSKLDQRQLRQPAHRQQRKGQAVQLSTAQAVRAVKHSPPLQQNALHYSAVHQPPK